MARRRKSASGNKSNDVNDDLNSNESTSNDTERGKIIESPYSSPSKGDADMEVEDSEENLNLSTTSENVSGSEEHLMPIDIQQMILGTGQSEEFIVSRGNAGEVELTVEPGNVLERKEEYEINTEEEDEEEVMYLDEEDDGDNQYVIVVNSDDIEVSDNIAQEISIDDLSAIQEGSCEIITVVRESDYDSSQESADGMDQDCDNINAVIGSVDGIHCIRLSQYRSEDEMSNDESADVERKEPIPDGVDNLSEKVNDITVREVNKTNAKSKPDLILTSLTEDKQSMTRKNLNNSLTCPTHKKGKISSNKPIIVLPNENLETHITGLKAPSINLASSPKKIPDMSHNKPDVSLNNSFKEKVKLIPVKPDISVTSQIEHTCKTNLNVPNISLATNQIKPRPTEVKKINTTFPTNENKNYESNKRGLKVSPKTVVGSPIELASPAKENNKLGNEDASKLMDISKNSNDRSTEKDPSDYVSIRGEREPIKTASDIKYTFEKVKEHQSASDSSMGSKSAESVVSKLPEKDSGLEKKNLQVENSSANLTGFDQQKVEVKEEPVKKEEDDKQNTFRSRSGSTDTTSSESGSNSGSGRRRSGRIKTIAESKLSEAEALTVVTVPTPAPATPPVPGFEPDKPVKVKSRWRRTSELEMVFGKKQEPDLTAVRPQAESPPPLGNDVLEVLFSFQHLDCNDYLSLTDKSKCKDKRMVCDCVLTKEELARGDMGCGEDCLNRLLMIECGARCMLGERCSNKRFQNLEYAKCEVFKTEMKGFGLRATEDLPEDTFLLEYVGEVLDPKEFRRRAKEYAKDKNRHFYFMALKSDLIIDATQKGNISRFINHSCDPNAETQKWTVNGELRIGFFSKRAVAAGEEITFDYKLQRYGKEAQRCFCKAKTCRGWIGEDPEKENKWSEVSGRKEGKDQRKDKEKKKREEKKVPSKDILSDIDLEEEIDLGRVVLKNRAQTLLLCRLMVRAEAAASRSQLLSVLGAGQPACQRLFLDYHGLRLVWSWMMDPASTSSLKLQILETLSKLPIPNKTMLLDSKVLATVEKWSDPNQIVEATKDRSSAEEECEQLKGDEKNSEDLSLTRAEESEEELEKNKVKIAMLATALVAEWTALKEVFRIPKKERIEQIKEHEREADNVFRDGSEEKQDKYDRQRSRNDYDRRDRDRDRDRERDRERDRDRDRKRGRDSPDSDRSRKSSRFDDRGSQQLTKMERRQLFAIQAAQDEEERNRQRHQAQAQAQAQAQMAAIFPPVPPQWMPFPQDPSMLPPQPMEGQPMFPMVPNNPPPFLFSQSGPLQHPPFLEATFHAPPAVFNPPPPLPKQPFPPHMLMPHFTPPLPSQPPPVLPQFSQPPPFTQPPVSSVPFVPPLPQSSPSPAPAPAPAQQPLASPTAVPLPPRWKSAADSLGRTYYYHVKLRVPQWVPPVWETGSSHDTDSESDSSNSDDGDSSSDDDEQQPEEEKVEGEAVASATAVEPQKEEEDLGCKELPEVEVAEGGEGDSPYEPETMELLEDIAEDESQQTAVPIPIPLVQQRIISPRTAEEIPDKIDKKKIRELKEQIRREKAKQKAKEKAKIQLKVKTKLKGSSKRSGTNKCEADTSSSDAGRKIKDTFLQHMANVIVHYLNAYRKPDCKIGKITCTEDFKHLAKKLNHFVMLKELKHCRSVDELVCNDNVKHKARDFVRKYMAKFGAVYSRPADDD